ncbi:hypothetical protein HK104_008570 [Borealophlyctis nickersoniae]|nr:hypothetical protein HK104_008570 [Borealophlyctis nickersoniae]
MGGALTKKAVHPFPVEQAQEETTPCVEIEETVTGVDINLPGSEVDENLTAETHTYPSFDVCAVSEVRESCELPEQSTAEEATLEDESIGRGTKVEEEEKTAQSELQQMVKDLESRLAEATMGLECFKADAVDKTTKLEIELTQYKEKYREMERRSLAAEYMVLHTVEESLHCEQQSQKSDATETLPGEHQHDDPRPPSPIYSKPPLYPQGLAPSSYTSPSPQTPSLPPLARPSPQSSLEHIFPSLPDARSMLEEENARLSRELQDTIERYEKRLNRMKHKHAKLKAESAVKLFEAQEAVKAAMRANTPPRPPNGIPIPHRPTLASEDALSVSALQAQLEAKNQVICELSIRVSELDSELQRLKSGGKEGERCELEVTVARSWLEMLARGAEA